MSMNFIEPDVQQTVPVSVVLENLSISSENKKWLLSLFLEDIELSFDFKDVLSSFLNEINEEDSSAFLLSFLFDFCVSNHEYFIESKLLSERIKSLPSLFTKKTKGKPSVFEPYVANILDNILKCAEKDKDFSDAYKKELQEIRAISSFEERAVYYVKLVFQNLPKRTYKEDEKPPTQKTGELVSFLDFWEKDFLNMPYSLRLIAELEGMFENELYVNYFYPGKLIPKYNISTFPFIVYGKDLYICIHKTMLLKLKIAKKQEISSDDIEQIKIPCWNEKNHIHEFFFDLALSLKDKDNLMMLILNKIFEGVNLVDIPYIFFEYIEDCISSIYRVLFKGGYYNFEQHFKNEYSDVIKPIREKLEYLDWALTSNLNDLHEIPNDPHEIHFKKSRLFLDYIEKLSYSAPEDKLELFQELFFEKGTDSNPFQDKFYVFRGRTIKDILSSIALKRNKGEWTFPERQEEANGLYEKFVDVIAKGAAKYPAKLFLGEKWQNLSLQKQNDHGLIVFKQYCENLELKTYEDAIFLSEFWFKLFFLEQPFFLSSSDTTCIYYSKLEEEGPFFYKNIFCKFINDENFICSFLSIPQKYSSACSLVLYCLACLVLYQKNKDENISDIISDVKKASKLLHDEKITFPAKIAEVIKSYKIPDGLKGNGYDNEAKRFLFYLIAVLGGEQYQNILKNLNNAEGHFPIYYIRYKYSHDNFIPKEFLYFLFNLVNPSLLGNKNEFYCLELIQEACKDGVLKKQIVLEKVSNYIEENRKLLFKYSEIKKFITYFFIEIEEGETHEAQMAFFTHFCERAVQETEDSYAELYLFFKICQDFYIDMILEKHTDINNTLVTRCCKMLNNFRKNIEKKEFSEDEYHFINDYILPASYFVWERTGNIWKALKPLILAFRTSKSILLDESLNINDKNILSYSLIKKGIIDFFYIEDQEKLKELRYDMANDFSEYLKPTKNERQVEKYTQTEINEKGFDLSYTEPSPYWRYAYVRALGDLGVKTDKRGHYFKKILENVSEEDPSEDVKTAAKKVMKKLDSIRKGYSGANHKKCLFEAFWWLKCAHIISFGVNPDKKALELRIKEWR